MTKQITIRVFPDGRIESETHGIKGKDCLKYIKEIEQLTDAKIVRSEFTEEYRQVISTNDVSDEVHQQSGY